MPHLDVDGCELYYEVDGEGPALIFAHGLGGNHLSWWQQVPAFKDRYTCVTIAHRGFAPSRAPQGADPSKYASDLAALIDHLGFADVRLVAQSMGGWTCLGYTLAHPERVKALVMCDTVGGLVHPDIDRIFKLRDGGVQEDLFRRGIHPACGERMAREQPALHFLYKEIDRMNADWDKMKLREGLYFLRDAPAALVEQLTVPLLCLAGAEDIVIPPEAPQILASLVPGARFEAVPKAGHSVYFERPETFNRIVGSFLDT